MSYQNFSSLAATYLRCLNMCCPKWRYYYFWFALHRSKLLGVGITTKACHVKRLLAHKDKERILTKIEITRYHPIYLGVGAILWPLSCQKQQDNGSSNFIRLILGFLSVPFIKGSRKTLKMFFFSRNCQCFSLVENLPVYGSQDFHLSHSFMPEGGQITRNSNLQVNT